MFSDLCNRHMHVTYCRMLRGSELKETLDIKLHWSSVASSSNFVLNIALPPAFYMSVNSSNVYIMQCKKMGRI